MKPFGQRSRTSAERHCSSLPKASRKGFVAQTTRTRDATLNAISVTSLIQEHIENIQPSHAECHG